MFFFSCKKEQPVPNVKPPDTVHPAIVHKIELSSNKASIRADGIDQVSFSTKVWDAKGKQIDHIHPTLYINGVKRENNLFAAADAGEYQVVAKYENITSNTVLITAESPVKVQAILLKTNTKLMIADGRSAVRMDVKLLDENRNEISGKNYELYINGKLYPHTAFVTTESGEYVFEARSGDVSSETVSVYARADKHYPIVTIPVIFHVGHFGEASGTASNLSQAEVKQALDRLNSLFANEVSSENPNAVDMRVRFRLAWIGPDEKPLAEPGIIRHHIGVYDDGASPDAYDIAADNMLGANEAWKWALESVLDPHQYLNVWVFQEQYGQSTAGLPRVYSSHPLEGLDELPDDCDSCPPDADYLKNIFVDTDAFTITNATALAHEIGHALGLLHVFSTNYCLTSDYCPDTYSYRYENYDLSASCPGNLGWQGFDNIMDYYGRYDTFTYDQRERVQHVLRHAHWISSLPRSVK